MKLFVGNLSPQFNEERLTGLVTPFGTPASLSIVRDKKNGESRGFAFVEFGDESAAKAAIAALDGKEIDGKALKVNEARERHVRGASA